MSVIKLLSHINILERERAGNTGYAEVSFPFLVLAEYETWENYESWEIQL